MHTGTRPHDTEKVDLLVATYLPEIEDDIRRSDISSRLRNVLSGAPVVRAQFNDEFSAELVGNSSSVQSDDPFFTALVRSLVDGWLPRGPGIEVPPALRGELVDRQAEVVGSTLLRSLLQELHARRDAGELTGETPQERFDDFCRWLRTPAGATAFESGHRGALTWARRQADRVAAVTVETLQRVDADRRRIAEVMPGVSVDAPVTQVGLGSGDPHRDGRSVALIRFADGGRVVYRPRDVGIDVAWNGFLADCNALGITDLRTIATLDCGTHGYAEHIVADGRTPGDGGSVADRYTQGVGQLTAVLHLLRGTDIHHENLLTSGGLPVVVDTETVLTPRPVEPASYDAGAGSRIARDEVLDSVLGIGILPNLVRAPGRDLALDVGAVGYSEGQLSPFRAMGVANAGRDDMHTVLLHAAGQSPSANPVIGAAEGEARLVRDRIASSFRETCERVMENREEVLRALRSRFEGVVLRYVHAPTLFYAQLLRMGTHPDLLEDEAARTAVFYRVSLREGGTARSLADAELSDLRAGDVPYFWCRSDETSLRHDRSAAVEGFFVESAVATAERRVQELSTATIERQLRLLDLAFVNRLDSDREATVLARPARSGLPLTTPRAADLVRALADALADDCTASTDPDHPATWVGPQVTTSEQSQWLPGTLGYDLYGGSTGVALFLAAAAAEQGEPTWARVADSVLRPVEEQIVEGRIEAADISAGGMTGIGGTVWALATTRSLLDAAGLLEGGRADAGRDALLLQRLGEGDHEQAAPDFTSGLAGTLAAGLDVEHRSADGLRSSGVDAVAQAMIESLDRWRAADLPLYTGYAHGLAGMAPPLLRWALDRGDDAAERIALDLVAELLEQRLPDGDWPRRIGGDADERSYAWCHGAPGLLLGLLDVDRLRPGVVPARVLAELADLSRDRAIGHNPTLCHGDLGTLDVLAEAAGHLGSVDHARFVRESLDRVVADRLQAPGRPRASKYDATDSLMVGTAGLGWSVLRHGGSARLPSVLALR